MLAEQGLEQVAGGGGIGVFDRQPGQLLAAGQVANGEQIAVLSFDGRRRFGVIDRPDSARTIPVQGLQQEAVLAAIDAAEAATQVGQFIAGDVGAEGLQRRHASVRQHPHQADDFVAGVPVSLTQRPAAGLQTAQVLPGFRPLGQGARREMQALGRLAASQAALGRPAAKDEDAVAQQPIQLALRTLTCGATAGFDPREDLRFIWTFELQVLGANGWMRDELVALLDLVRRGSIAPVIDTAFGLEDANAAFALLEERRSFGKVLIRP